MTWKKRAFPPLSADIPDGFLRGRVHDGGVTQTFAVPQRRVQRIATPPHTHTARAMVR